MTADDYRSYDIWRVTWPVTFGLVVSVLGSIEAHGEPIRGPDLILWLDAQDIGADGTSNNNPGSGATLACWRDKSEYANHATQATPDRQPTLSQGTAALKTVRFDAAKRQYLSVQNGVSLTLSQITAFVVAKASDNSSAMWLFGKCNFSGPWTGYGIAVHGGEVSPWPHLGLGHNAHDQNGYLKYHGNIRQRLAIVEIVFDGRRLRGLLNGEIDRVQGPIGGIQANDRRSADRRLAAASAGRAVSARRNRRNSDLHSGFGQR